MYPDALPTSEAADNFLLPWSVLAHPDRSKKLIVKMSGIDVLNELHFLTKHLGLREALSRKCLGVGLPLPGTDVPGDIVTGMPIAVQPFRTAMRT